MHAPRLKLNRAMNARAAASWKCTCHLRRLMSFIPRLRARIIHFASTAVKGAPKDGKPLSRVGGGERTTKSVRTAVPRVTISALEISAC